MLLQKDCLAGRFLSGIQILRAFTDWIPARNLWLLKLFRVIISRGGVENAEKIKNKQLDLPLYFYFLPCFSPRTLRLRVKMPFRGVIKIWIPAKILPE